ncbi:peroxidase family protein [Streptomyces sp. NRRL F-2580]|uniref:peroxidase family protein n=1 Tax=Streptomyces sp. NRRL F-2580 TaxID=1463841 RepID=UPI00227721FA|nr:peroxidase family protein [Streptomyces sp. NRRL F-2580]
MAGTPDADHADTGRPDPGPSSPAGTPDIRINVSSHWWDASQIYGTNEAEQLQVRTGKTGKLHLFDDEPTPRPSDGSRDPSRVPGFWLGLVMMQNLFAHEHNAICDHLHAAYPSWDDEELFQRARLVNAALLAKIHTVEWTPAVISHPTTVTALRSNWWGIAGERVHNFYGRISESETISGIPGTKTDHYGVPYALTEEFAAVYRMHPLIRDNWHLRSVTDDSTLSECTFRDLAGPEALNVLKTKGMANLFYSFGTLHPGLVTLHNFPKLCRTSSAPTENGRTSLPRTSCATGNWASPATTNPATAAAEARGELRGPDGQRRVGQGDLEKVDLTIGMYAERPPTGFAFSDTAFRIFILMASRRLNSDRFFTDYYTPEVYSKAGMAWIDDNSMVTVLLRHYPELRTALAGLKNAFVPWHTASGSTHS